MGRDLRVAGGDPGINRAVREEIIHHVTGNFPTTILLI